MSEQRPLIGVGAAIFKDGDVLLIQRGKPPGVGRWSVPGGHLEWGEHMVDCAAREVAEETGIACEIMGFTGCYDALGPVADGKVSYHFVLLNYWGQWRSGDPAAADDAMDARWVHVDEMGDYDMWPETRDMVRKAAQLRITRK